MSLVSLVGELGRQVGYNPPDPYLTHQTHLTYQTELLTWFQRGAYTDMS